MNLICFNDMVKQTPVLVKLDTDQLVLLNDLCKNLGINRNKFINFAVSQAVDHLSEYRTGLLVSTYQKALKALL